jgi:hypothetical protein
MIIELLNAATIVLAAGVAVAPSIPMVPDGGFMLPSKLGEIMPITTRGYWRFGENSGCKWYGFTTPYVRDWDEERTNAVGMPEIIKTEPEKIAGRAVIFVEKVCEGHRTPVAYIDSVRAWGMGIGEGNRLDATDLSKLPVASRPRWLDQVVKRLDDAGRPELANVARTHAPEAGKPESLAVYSPSKSEDMTSDAQPKNAK